jgi:leucyl-tRNA synthetase
VKDLLLLLAPFVPHVAEELWHSVIDENSSVHDQSWPEYDEAALKVDNVEIVLQINGKVRGRLVVPSEASKEELEKVALADERIKSLIGDGTVRKVIAVPGRLVNIVVK